MSEMQRGVPRIPDEEADADAADQHLGRDDGEPGQANADAKAGEHVRHGRRHHDAREEFDGRQAQDLGDVAIILRDVADAHRSVDQDWPDAGDEDNEDGGGLAVAESRQRERQPGERRNGAQNLEYRIEAAHGERRLAEQDAHADADDRGEDIADSRRGEGGRHVPEKPLVDAVADLEGIDDDLPALVDDLQTDLAAPKWGSMPAICQRSSRNAMVRTGGASCLTMPMPSRNGTGENADRLRRQRMQRAPDGSAQRPSDFGRGRCGRNGP